MNKIRFAAALACFVQLAPVWAAPPEVAKVTKADPCAKTKVGCPKAMAVPRDNDPGIMPMQTKKPSATTAVKPIVAAPEIKPDKVAGPR